MDSNPPVFRRIFPLFLIAMAILVLFILFFNITSRLSDLSEAPKDNISWALSQVEVDTFLLSDAANAVSGSDNADLKELRRRFNNLYSRIGLLRQSRVFEDMRADPKFSKLLITIEKCLNNLVPMIDAADAELVRKISAIKKEIAVIRPKSHQIALTGLSLSSAASDTERASLSKLLLLTASVSMALVAFLVLVSYFLMLQHRKSRQISIEIKRASARLKSSFETSLDAIIVANSHGKILDFNASAESVFGFSKSEAIGAKLTGLIIPEKHHEAHGKGLAHFLTTKGKKLISSRRVETTALRKTGEEFQIEISVGQAEDQNGIIFVAYIRDITERLAAEENLKLARDEALKAEKTISNFLAVMSHELRTPLNGLFGTIELLQGTTLTPKQAGYLELAKSSSDILLHHVNEVLDISRLDVGKLKLSPNTFDLKSFFQNAIATNQGTAIAHNNKLVLDLENMPDKPVYLDEHRLLQIVYNLLSNALKFTINGTVKITVATNISDAGVHELEFSVSDTGIGISKDDIELIFDKFYTQDKSYDRIASGAGLGLTICNRIVDVMGGEILVNSKKQKGSTFTVRIPIALDEAKDETPVDVPYSHPPEILNGCHVLLVEDNEINRTIVKDMLEKDGVTVIEAKNGLEAIEAASEQTFDIILMDVSMPVVNGVDATIQIRKNNDLSSKVPIIGLTAHALKGEQERFIQSGMDACLSKPISHQLLVSEMARILAKSQISDADDIIKHPVNGFDFEIFHGVRNALSQEKLDAILIKYKTEIEYLLTSIPNLVTNDDYDALSASAHKSIGSSGILGATQLLECLRKLEQASKDKNADLCTEIMPGLERSWTDTWKQLQSAI